MCKILFFILLSFLRLEKIHAIFLYPPPNQVGIISSDGWNYPNHTTDIDIIWRFSHSIQLDLNELEMDGQSGDFLLISDLPLTFEDSFEDWNNSEELPPFLAESIVTSHGILLSWKLDPGARFQVLSRHGTFVYFHAEGGLTTRGTHPYAGFNITVQDLDELRKPPPTSTTEGTRPPPAPEVEIYTSKFLKNPPFEFRERKNEFKSALATLATEYCAEHSCSNLATTPSFTAQDVSIPDNDGLRMCDITWDLYDSCVEVTFAVIKNDQDGGDYLTKSQVDDMWAKNSAKLEQDYGFIPYDNHPKSLPNIDTWIWMASFLGIILFLMAPVCVFWILHEVQNNHLPSAINTEEMDKAGDGDREGGFANNPWIDLANPIRPILAKLKRQSVDNKYLLDVGYSDSNTNTLSEPANYKPKTKTNVLFQEQDVTFEYENRGYLPDAGVVEDDDDEVVLYGHGQRERDFMDIADEDFPPEDRFLRIERGAQFGENSDTEI